MPSYPRRVLILSLILASTLPLAGLSACASRPNVILSASPCSTLVPESWKAGVPAPDLPGGSTAGEWAAFADSAVGRLDIANGRALDGMRIVEACEARDKASAEALKPKPWWRFAM